MRQSISEILGYVIIRKSLLEGMWVYIIEVVIFQLVFAMHGYVVLTVIYNTVQYCNWMLKVLLLFLGKCTTKQQQKTRAEKAKLNTVSKEL